MKRFFREVSTAATDGGWRVLLDGRGIKTQGGAAQVVPTRALAEALAAEWTAQGDEIDPATFVLRDMADHAIDVVMTDRADTIDTLLRYAETDTLCYRADPDEPLYQRQQERWEPALCAAETRLGVQFKRVSGVIHRPQPSETLERLRTVLDGLDPFTLAALTTLTSLAASLAIGLGALEPDADARALWDLANLEEDWQAEQWGKDWEAEERRERRLAAFSSALDFARLARS